MTAPRKKVWSIEPHTRAKHDLLSHYLRAWYPIIGRYSQRAVFIDAFAGPGVYEDGSPGSPIIALRTLLDHSAFATLRGCTYYFLFIESDKKRFAHLEAEITKLGALPANVQVMLRNSDFVTVADELASLIRDKKQGLAPTLARSVRNLRGPPQPDRSTARLRQVRAVRHVHGRPPESVRPNRPDRSAL